MVSWAPLLALALGFAPESRPEAGPPTAAVAAAAQALSPRQGSRARAGHLDSLLAVGDSALARDEFAVAERAAREARRLAPRDPRTLMLAGRVELERPVIGRFRALELFRAAARIDPDDAEPWYWIGRVGMALKGDDGEGIARPAFERVLARDPFYRDAWEMWRSLHLGRSQRAATVRALTPHAADPEVASRIAWLDLETGNLAVADSILAAVQARAGADPRWSQWRAEIAFLQGRDSAGLFRYAEATELSAWDSTDEIWRAVAGIATPEERARYVQVCPSARPTFYRGFWDHRDPNLLTPENERIAEHFRRRAEARRMFGLKHPLSKFHYSPAYRDLVSFVSMKERKEDLTALILRGDEQADAIARAAGLAPAERVDTGEAVLTRLAAVSRAEADIRRLGPEVLPLGVNLVDRVDDRGLAFIRHGRPSRRQAYVGGEELWTYDTPPHMVLRFDLPDPTEAPVGDILFRPVNRATAQGVGVAMTTDRTAVEAPLEFGFWLARFRGPVEGSVRTYLFVDSLHAAGALFDGTGRRFSGDMALPGEPLVLDAPWGDYLLGLDVEKDGRLGRARRGILLPAFRADSLALSDLIVARARGMEAAATGATRDALAALALPGLRARADEPFWVYGELYGMVTGPDGFVRYEVTYEFVHARGRLARVLKGDDRVAFRFVRQVPARPDGVVEERLFIQPRDLRPGGYELRLRVRDLISGALSESRSLRIEVQ